MDETPALESTLEALLISTGIVALAEIGDKTQLLSLALATRYKRPWPIILGILVATLLNHALAAGLGTWLTGLIGPEVLRWVLALSFFAMAAWMLVPDRLDEAAARTSRWGVLATTTLAFFIVEMGDKTQIATIALAARFDAFQAVVAGTTLGMLIANAPVVVLGDRVAGRLPVRLIHRISAAIFAALGVLTLLAPA